MAPHSGQKLKVELTADNHTEGTGVLGSADTCFRPSTLAWETRSTQRVDLLRGALPKQSHADRVIPQSLVDAALLEDWGWTEGDYEDLKHTWGNLVPLTAPANQEKGTMEFAECRQLLLSDGNIIFKTTRQLFENHDAWTPGNVRKRAEQLAKFAVKRWARLHAA